MMDLLEVELTSGNRKPENEKQYAKYIEISEPPVRGIKITPKKDSITRAEKDYGFFALINNDTRHHVIILRKLG